MASRKPLYNSFLQNDLDGAGYNMRSLNAVDALAGSTVFVDQSLPLEIGKIGSTMAFKSLQSALSAAPPNYSIIIRPGTYLWDGIVPITRSHIKIYGEGVTISPVTPGEQAGFRITGNYVELHGITFDGLLTGSPSNTGATIEVDGATNVTLDRIRIVDQHGHGILLADFWSAFEARDCNFDHCNIGISGSLTDDINDVTISGSSIQNCREGGIILVGDANVHLFRQIRISNNTVNNCDGDGVSAPSIEISGGATDVLVHGNYCARSYYGIVLGQVARAEVTANNIFGADEDMIRLLGCQVVTVSSNVLDGSSPANGAPHANVGLSMTGDYAVANDAGPYSIVGNLFSGISSGGKTINLANADDVTIAANNFGESNAYLHAAAFDNVQISSNLFKNNGTAPCINLDAAERGWTGLTINGNRFRVAGNPTRLIAFNDATSTGMVGLNIVGNRSTTGKTYTNGIIGNVTGSTPTALSLHSNTPLSTTRTNKGYDLRYGWVNDDMPELVFDTLFVSKLVGDDSTGTREDKTLPFLTINAAISAASSGDVVKVTDGTFNELVEAKDGITLEFLADARLTCATTGGCIKSTAINQVFTVYHNRGSRAITTSEDATSAITISHTGCIFKIYGPIVASGSTCTAVLASYGTIEIFGDITTTYRSVILPTGSVAIVKIHNSLVSSTGSSAILIDGGKIVVDNSRLKSTGASGVILNCDDGTSIFRNCTIVGGAPTSTYTPVYISTAGATTPIFRSCVLVSGTSATDSIATIGAQTVTLYGSNVANKGSNPPTNITFDGGGTYAVDAGVTDDY